MNQRSPDQDRVIVCGVKESSDTANIARDNAQELNQLVSTAGGEIVHELIAPLREPNVSTYLGKGKLEELRGIIETTDANLVVIDGSLTGSQVRNLEKVLDCRVIDRTELILDIFALHAHTTIGKVQVELAQLMHRKTKLRVHAGELSGLGGGIGTRGPGETKLEVDRRRIDDRISMLRRQLQKLHQRQQVQRKGRLDPKIQHVALIGYTNAGKSTLMNALTDAGVLVEDKLFATLDTTTRKLVLPCGRHVVLTDTVGFIRKLPHEIVEAFQSTFQEAREADLVLHLVDASKKNSSDELKVGMRICEEMDVRDVPVLYVLTKKDICARKHTILSKAPTPHVAVSSTTGEGIDLLMESISLLLETDFEEAGFFFPYKDAGMIYKITKYGRILEREDGEEGTRIQAKLPGWLSGMLKKWIVPPSGRLSVHSGPRLIKEMRPESLF